MATTDIDKIFQEADAGSEASPPANGKNEGVVAPDGIKPPTDLKAAVAAKRKGKGGSAAPAGSSAKTSTVPDAGSQPLAATDGVSPGAKDELAKLASKKEAEAGNGEGVPAEIPGLTSGGTGNAYEQRQAELAAARAKATGGKGKKMTAAEKRKAEAAKAKEKALKDKAKAKEKTQKQKDAEKARADKKKEASAERKKKEDERKATIAKAKADRAAARAAKATPDLLAKEPAQIKALFAEHYRIAGPKTDRVPDGQGIRRAKADRGDFCAGWVTLLRLLRKEGLKLPGTAPAAKA